jgi:hypothetical protein
MYNIQEDGWTGMIGMRDIGGVRRKHEGVEGGACGCYFWSHGKEEGGIFGNFYLRWSMGLG